MSPMLHLRKSLAYVLMFSLFITGLLTITPRQSHASNNSLMRSSTSGVNLPSEETGPQTKTVDEATRARISEAYNKIPLSFEENRGQVDKQVKYLSRGSGYTLFLTPTEAVLALRKADEVKRNEKPSRDLFNPHPALRTPQSAGRQSTVLRMKLSGANKSPDISGESEMGVKTNYFIGNDPEKWHTDVARHERVRYSQVYPGVDMIYYGRQQQVEYDFEVAPGADSRQITLEFTGVNRVKIDRETGDLLLKTAGVEVRQHKPVPYQEVGGQRREVASQYVIKGKRKVGIEVGEYDRTKPLVIDPVLSYSTYLGGSGNEIAQGIAVDGSGNVYVTGVTESTNFPTLHQYQTDPAGDNIDAFVTKLMDGFISGRITSDGTAGIIGVTVTLSGSLSRTVRGDGDGYYSFTNLPLGGNYTVTPSKGNLTFIPSEQSFTNFQANQTNVNFTTQPATINGKVTLDTIDGSGMAGVTITLTRWYERYGFSFTPRTATTASDGTYSFTDVPTPANYTLTPSKHDYTFHPEKIDVSNVSGGNRPTKNFVATWTYTIGGVVKFGADRLAGVTMTLTSPTPAGFAPRTVTTSSTGVYSFTGVPALRNYTVTPQKTGYQFTPANKSLPNLSANQTAANFLVKVHSITGRITRTGTSVGIGAVTLTLTSPTPAGFPARTTQTSSTGIYTFTNLPAGRNYKMYPTKSGFTFSPATRSLTNLSGNIPAGASTNFTGAGP